MAILGIETTGPYCSVGLLDEEGQVYVEVGSRRFQHLATVTSMIEKILRQKNITFAQVDTLAVSVGPGSFTGIRIGVTTARALSQLTEIKLLPVPTLEAFALQEREKGFLLCPILDARRGQVYGGAYDGTKEVVPGGPYLLEEFVEKIRAKAPHQPPLFVGDGVPVSLKRLEQSLGKKNFSQKETFQSARGVLAYAQDYKGDFLKDPNELFPNYMRMAEAERQRLAKEREKGK